MKILHVSQPTTAGVAAVVRQAVRYQRDHGHTVAVACPDGRLAEGAREAGAIWYPWESTRQPGPSVIGEARRLRSLIHEIRPEVLHLHASKAGLVGRLVAGRVPVIFQPHSWSFEAADGLLASASRQWEVWAQRRTAATVWCSWGEQTVGLMAGVRAAGVVSLNGVDLDRFRPAGDESRRRARAELGLPAEAQVAVVVGRLAPQKGQDVLIRAWPQIRARTGDARLLLIGDGPEADALHELAGEGVHFLGDQVSPQRAFDAADLSVLPSRWEGMSLSMIEGMACGLSTVATDVSGAREAILSGHLPPAGAIVPPDDVDALAGAVGARLRDRGLRTREARAARARAESQFTTDQAMATFMDAYALARVPTQRSRPSAPPLGLAVDLSDVSVRGSSPFSRSSRSR